MKFHRLLVSALLLLPAAGAAFEDVEFERALQVANQIGRAHV